jgi:hypothetical protein
MCVTLSAKFLMKVRFIHVRSGSAKRLLVVTKIGIIEQNNGLLPCDNVRQKILDRSQSRTCNRSTKRRSLSGCDTSTRSTSSLSTDALFNRAMSTKSRDRTVEAVLSTALFRLNRVGSFEEHFEYIKSEWYFTVSDLLMALEDGKAWSDLRLPGRLKLEMKAELLDLQYLSRHANESFEPTVNLTATVPIMKKEQWTRHYSNEHDTFFFYCLTSDSTQWEIPIGNVDITDDITKQILHSSAMYTDHHEKISNGASSADSNVQNFTASDTSHEKYTDENLDILRAVNITPFDASQAKSKDENLNILMAVNAKVRNQVVVTDAFAVNGDIPVGVLVDSAYFSEPSYNSEESINIRTETDESCDDLHSSSEMPPPYDADLDTPNGVRSSTPKPSPPKIGLYQPRTKKNYGVSRSSTAAQSIAF